MREFIRLFKIYIYQFLLLLLVFTICRIGFWSFNYTSFGSSYTNELGTFLWKGLRFDISAISILTLLFALINTFSNHSFIKNILPYILWIPIVVALLFEIGDWLYFPFNHKRSTAEVLKLFWGDGDFFKLLPSFLKDFYYIFLVAIVVIVAYIYCSKKLFQQTLWKTPGQQFSFKLLFSSLSYFILMAGLLLVGIRGGFQLIPIHVRNAVEVVDAKYAAVVLNTPFSIAHTIANQHLENIDWMSEEEMNQWTITIHQEEVDEDFTYENVMFIVLESLSKDFTKLGGGESYTPFFDELLDKSIVFTNAYATGLHSAEGIPAILASMPSWMSENFTASVYGSNQIHGIGTLLKSMGYNTAFYHGANNGSMGFDVFSRNAGFDKYYGRNEYGNDEHFDGAWGIFDKPFFQFALNKINEQEEPFVSCLFSISAHSPYALPEEDKVRLETKDWPIYGTITYTDEALAQFFEVASQQDWFENTWFIITADHTSPMNGNREALKDFTRYEIPLVFYHPLKTQEASTISTTVNQLDIMPMLLKKMNYPHEYFAFGNADLEKGLGMMAELNNQYYVMDREGCAFSAISHDADKNNINIAEGCEIEDNFWKSYLAYRQKYVKTLINNSVPRK